MQLKKKPLAQKMYKKQLIMTPTANEISSWKSKYLASFYKVFYLFAAISKITFVFSVVCLNYNFSNITNYSFFCNVTVFSLEHISKTTSPDKLLLFCIFTIFAMSKNVKNGTGTFINISTFITFGKSPELLSYFCQQKS